MNHIAKFPYFVKDSTNGLRLLLPFLVSYPYIRNVRAPNDPGVQGPWALPMSLPILVHPF